LASQEIELGCIEWCIVLIELVQCNNDDNLKKRVCGLGKIMQKIPKPQNKKK
jgi:hypothetical protein